MIHHNTEKYSLVETAGIREVHDFNPRDGWENETQPERGGASIKNYVSEDREEFKCGSYGKESLEDLQKGKAGQRLLDLVQAKEGAEQAGAAMKRKRRRRKNEFDGEVDIDSYLSGDPQYYRKVERMKRSSKGVSVLINMSQPGRVSADDVAKLVLNAMNVAYGYAQKGIAVEIKTIVLSCEAIEGSKKLVGWINTVKPGNRPFDISRLYSVVYPAYFRVYGFRSFGVAANLIGEEIKGDLGIPVTSLLAKTVPDEINMNMIKEAPGVDQEAIYFDSEITEGKRVKNL